MSYGAIPTIRYLEREAAAAAGAPRVVFTTVALGDAVPPTVSPGDPAPAGVLSDQGLGLIRERWRGGVASVAVNADNAQQIDICVHVPDAAPSFVIREIAVFDEAGDQVVCAVTNIVKPSSAVDNVAADFTFYVSILVSNASAVVVVAPTGGYATIAYVDERIQEIAFVPPAAERGVEYLPAARKYRGVLANTTTLGVVRQATDMEAQGIISSDALTDNPYVTPAHLLAVRQQIPEVPDVSGLLPRADLPGADRGITRDDAVKKYRGVIATTAALGVSRQITQAERVAGAVAAGSTTANPYLGLAEWLALVALIPPAAPAWNGLGCPVFVQAGYGVYAANSSVSGPTIGKAAGTTWRCHGMSGTVIDQTPTTLGIYMFIRTA